MILTLPVSHLINKDNYLSIPGIKALEYKKPSPILNDKMKRLFHSASGIIQNDFIEYFNSVIGYLLKNRVELFSFDLGPAAENVEIRDSYYTAISKPLSIDELKDKINLRLSYIKSKFGGDIALENLGYYPTTAYGYVCEADFITDVVQKNNVYLILDIAHAIITAHNFGVDKYEYISSLPLEKVKEIHLSAPGLKDRRWLDLHEKPASEEFKVLDFIIKRIAGDPYLVVEYYKDLSGIAEAYRALDSLAQMIR